jgi:chemotaxis-related protein WspD
MSLADARPESSAPGPETGTGTGTGTVESCWNTIGVMGDHSCPELEVAVHCRNCPVFARAARDFLERPAPEGYLAEWSRDLEGSADGPGGEDPHAVAARDGTGDVIFRLGAEWLAFRAKAVVEVAPVRPVHRIPHRTNAVVAGLVNLRGQLQLCVSLHGLLGALAGASGHDHDGPRARRMMIIRQKNESWVFAVDEVLGVPRVPPGRFRNVPSTLANPAVSFSQSVFDWEGRSVGLLDEGRVFHALRSLGA